jgi:hypothetical protein
VPQKNWHDFIFRKKSCYKALALNGIGLKKEYYNGIINCRLGKLKEYR